MTCESEWSENVGLVRFELTIDGSLRHASVLQRVIIKHRNPDKVHDALSDRCQRDKFSRPIVHHLQHRNAKTAGARRHSGLGHNPPVMRGVNLPFADYTESR
jgi:hypothetical protein